MLEESKYENVLARMDDKTLVFERAILLKQYNNLKKQLSMLDAECRRRLDKDV